MPPPRIIPRFPGITGGARPIMSFGNQTSFFRSRNFTTATRLAAAQDPQKNTSAQRDAQQDREKINTDANEYARSGTDDEAAKNEDAAFNPKITDPQEAKEKAGEGNRVNPLDASPANEDLSSGTREESGGYGKDRSVNQ